MLAFGIAEFKDLLDFWTIPAVRIAPLLGGTALLPSCHHGMSLWPIAGEEA
jgi:hypothetical protein